MKRIGSWFFAFPAPRRNPETARTAIVPPPYWGRSGPIPVFNGGPVRADSSGASKWEKGAAREHFPGFLEGNRKGEERGRISLCAASAFLLCKARSSFVRLSGFGCKLLKNKKFFRSTNPQRRAPLTTAVSGGQPERAWPSAAKPPGRKGVGPWETPVDAGCQRLDAGQRPSLLHPYNRGAQAPG